MAHKMKSFDTETHGKVIIKMGEQSKPWIRVYFEKYGVSSIVHKGDYWDLAEMLFNRFDEAMLSIVYGMFNRLVGE